MSNSAATEKTESVANTADSTSSTMHADRSSEESSRRDGRMRAVVHTRYGSPDALKVRDVKRPTPDPGEVLIRVHAASVNAADWHVMRAEPFLVRLMGYGIRTPKHPGFGADVAGEVEAVGSDVTAFQPGDRVFGDLSKSGRGSFAEYVCASEDALAPIPDGVTFEEAAATPLAAVTALQGLRDLGGIRKGERVLVNGASGGVGTFAVQIAKAYGTKVTGVCRTEKIDTVRSLGADEVIDYTKVNFAETDERYDLILDVGAHQSVFAARRALAPGGRYVMVGGAFGPTLQTMVLGPLLSRIRNERVAMLMAEPNRADLDAVAELLASGDVVPIVDQRYPLEEVPEAIAYLESGGATGKVIITVSGRPR
jgi:NADPH:quinone reductase-like Zn-dependent oxidoreductase